jgi:tRNA A-37 threonylcarbamoyl transferase component Bud32
MPPTDESTYVRGPEYAATMAQPADMQTLSADASVGLPTVPGYEIEGELGRGGMGVVYKARQVKANRTVALKMILGGGHAGSAERERFRTEVEATARLKHPGIVSVYEVGEHAGLPYFSMEYVDGGSLAGLAGGRPMAPRAAAAIVERLARAVEAAHLAGIVHRDLKPGNILMAADGTPKVGDFGLAKRMDSDAGQTRSGAVMGSPGYMAPEQAAGRAKQVGPAADIYALGAILYELLTGRPPFEGESIPELLAKVAQETPEPPSARRPGVPRDLDTVTLKCLEKLPAHRYPTAAALAEDLRRFQQGESIAARELGVVERVSSMIGRGHADHQFTKYADFFLWMVPVMLVPELTATAVRYANASVWWDVAAFSLRPVCLIALLMRFGRGRLWPSNQAEQHMFGVWGGFVLTLLVLTACLGRWDDAGAVANRGMYQGYAAAAAVGFFSMGALFWGGCYVLGGVFVLMIPVLGVEPRMAPLQYGLTWAIGLLVIGGRLRRLARESAG